MARPFAPSAPRRHHPGAAAVVLAACGAALWLIASPGTLFAHEVRPAYLQITATGPETYEVLWKVPARGEDERLRLAVEFPAGTVETSRPRGWIANHAHTAHWTIRRPAGLAGGVVHIAGLTGSLTDVLVRVERPDGTAQVTRLTPAKPSFTVEAAPTAAAVAGTYLRLGVEHILLGIDHLLFVLALVLLVDGTRRLIVTITAFTVAHSLTLAAAALGFVHVPGPPVEAAIASSIVFVAAEIVHRRQRRGGLTERFPWLVAFAFGLLHGLGFAGALSEVGLPAVAIPIALLCFNLGVEGGQLVFIAVVLLCAGIARRLLRRARVAAPVWAWRIPPYAIGGVAAFWAIERVLAF